MPTTVEKILDAPRVAPAFSFRANQTAPLPSEMTFRRDQTSDGSGAYAFDQRKGLYVSRDADVPRYSDDPRTGASRGLLVESSPATNNARFSSDVESWNDNTSGVSFSNVDSIFAGAGSNSNIGPKEVSTSGSDSDRVGQNSGVLSGDQEIMRVIAEQSSASKWGFRIRNPDDGSDLALLEHTFSDDSLTLDRGSVQDMNVRELSTGPNGGRLVSVMFRVAGGNSSNIDGDVRQLFVFPDRNGNGDSTIIHHVDNGERRFVGAPIVTGSSAVTRQGERVAVDLSDVWNETEGTLLLTITAPFFSGETFNVIGAGSFERNLYIASNNPPYALKSSDGTNKPTVANAIPPFQPARVGVSFDKSQIAIAANGETDQAPHNGSLLANSVLDLVDSTDYLMQYDQIEYKPKALPAAESDRSAGDPPSLETLTSQP